MSVFIAHLTLIAPDTSPALLYVSDEPVRPLPANDPAAPNRIYEPVMTEPANVRREIFGDVTRGGGERGYGVMKLSNASGELSAYREHSFSRVEIFRYEPGATFIGAQKVFCGVITAVNWMHPARATAQVTLTIRDDLAVLETPVVKDRYLGTASGGSVLEGEEELSDRPRPLTLGDISTGHVPGVLVSPGQQIWQINAGAILSIDAVFDRADDAGYTNAGNLSEAAFLAATPSAADYVTHLDRGLIKLGGNPVGRVGFSVTETASATPRALIKRLLLLAGIDAGDISADFDVSGGPDVGVHLTADMSFGALIRFIARAETAAVAPDHTGSWRYSPLSGPKEIPDYDLPFDHIHDLTPVGQSAVPVSRVRIGYGRNHQALSRSDMAQAILGTSAETTMGSEWRYASAENTVTQSRWAGVEERTILTPIRDAADASALASSLLETLGPRAGGGAREQLRLVLPFDTDRAVLPLGSTVRVDYPPAGIDRTFVLTGAELTRPKREQMIWRVWG